jgi:A/G-specific adenine glycosylase
LAQWFSIAQRDLPWREAHNARDAYRVLVSEVMLQQTTVAAVVPFYQRFLERFPDVQTLARAEVESEVLPLWAGLGYYSRARNLHAAARAVIEKHSGVFPRHFDDVLALPGVGRYTAGAVCSIAFNQKVPIVDANVARVFSRIFCIAGDLKNAKNQSRLWSEAERVVTASTARCAAPSQINPAMMELGALVCIPKNPRCGVCPVSHFCCAFKTKRQNELPQIAPNKVEREIHDVCVFIGNAAGVLLRQRTLKNAEKNWWRGMWELPRATVAPTESTPAATRRLLDEIKIEGEAGRRLKTMKHSVTVHAITLDCFEVSTTRTQFDDAQFFAWEEIEALAIPSTMRKLLRWLQKHHVQNVQLELL